MRRIAALVLVLSALVACSHPEIDARASSDLQSRVDAIRTSVDAGDVEGAQVALGQLKRSVARWERRGDLSAARADQILAAARSLASALGGVVAPSPSVSPSPSPTAPPKSPKPPKPGKGNGGGNSDHAPGHEGD